MSISIRGLRKSFGRQRVLNDIDLDVMPGEMLALLGPSGCGKTTLLRVIAGLEGHESGTVMIDGTDACATPIRERGVGFVFQHYALFRHMTVFENVAFGLRVRPRSARPDDRQIREQVGDLLERVQLADQANRLPSQLSGGQRQRVALARALAVNPRVLLLDEPFGALDAQVRKELRWWLRQLHDSLGITSVFVTHDQDEALDIADRVVLMNAGRIEQVGTPAQVWKSPSNPFVYGFLGNVNVLPGTSDERGLRIGDAVFEVPTSTAGRIRPGLPARAYVRPDEFDLSRPAQGSPGLLARISRIAGVGAIARLELVPEHRGDSELPSSIEAAIAFARLNLEKWAVGDTVVVRATGGAIFAG